MISLNNAIHIIFEYIRVVYYFNK